VRTTDSPHPHRQHHKHTQRPPTPPDDAAEKAAIETAIWLARVEQVRADIRATVEDLLPAFPLANVRESIARARPNISSKTSKRWILEAINGRQTDTPGTGNCQNYAFVEAMAQRDLRDMEDPSSSIGSVIAFKYALYVAYMASSPTDRKNTSAAHLLSMPAGLPSDMSEDELHDLVRQHYWDLARSGSALNNVLEERLWGTFDTIRTGVMVVDAPVFLITQTSDATQCSLNVFRKLKNARGEVFVALSQPGVDGWLRELEDDATTFNRAPIVLVHSSNHYNGVIFDRHQPTNAKPVAKKMKTPVLNDLWNPLSLDTIIDNAKKNPARTTHSARREVLAADVRLTTTDMISFLADPGWSTAEKTEIAEILVSGATNFKELLTFSATSDGSAEQTPESDASLETKSVTSEYSPSCDGDSEESSTRALSLPSQEDANYRLWADSLWEPVREGWMEHNYVQLPALTDQEGLLNWINQLPEELLDASRWCANPFALLEHMTKDAIREWMQPTWLRLCDARLRPHVTEIKNPERRQLLLEWLDSIAQPDKLGVRLTKRKEPQRWEMLKEDLPQLCSDPEASRLLTKQLSVKAAYLLALNEIFPDLARQALVDGGWQRSTEDVDTMTAYAHAPAFTKAVNRAMRNHSWNPIAAYMNDLEMDVSQVPERRY
jgi:hypothetical protein